MFKLVKEYRFYLIIVALILIPILSLNTTSKVPTEFNFIDKTVVFITGPLQSAITFTVDRTARFFQNYLFLIHLKQEYAAVIEENRKLLSSIHALKEIEAENQRLRALLQFQTKINEQKLTAQIISKDVTTEFRSIRLNKGSQSGIQRGMAVVTHEGIVGKVLRTTADYADVITVLDNLSAIDSIVQRSRARGVLEGATDWTCILKYVLRTDDVEVGDTIVSSGLDGIYPKGLLLGTVIKVSKKNYGITQEVEVKPSVDFSKLEEVLVILKPDPHV